MDKPRLKLTGADGNAFMVLGLARQAARKAGWTHEQIKGYLDKAMGSDYQTLLNTTMEYFDVY